MWTQSSSTCVSVADVSAANLNNEMRISLRHRELLGIRTEKYMQNQSDRWPRSDIYIRNVESKSQLIYADAWRFLSVSFVFAHMAGVRLCSLVSRCVTRDIET